ncbi:unnamed protein product [Kluyveromyces dobzhanskii CBS 2104]|uniref:WGS project CCBQ000000000 data, contig 00016 n=1 Tax=Kluyveromyces dobzhanskii CBS 2104 TaxID=1427455 RepID=A0A0A8L1P4_9SACH|nr:unnamed protein product [Kluyveromyces dobzhanskii CBS 2104]
MPPKSTSSASKKKPSASASPSGEVKSKFKLPKQFIVRPIEGEANNNEGIIEVNQEVMESLELKNDSFCIVSREGENGIAAICKASQDDLMQNNVIKVTKALRSVGNLLLGDRIELRKLSKQPEYLESITVGNLQREELPTETLKRVENTLDKCGILMPGMIFRSFRVDESTSVDLIVIDINQPVEELPDLSKLTLSESAQLMDHNYLSPPGLFKKNFTRVIHNTESEVQSRYGLPQPVLYSAVGGLTKETSILKSTVELPLHQPQLFTDFGISPPRGILLHGPPGTGKTMLLRCVANETEAHVLTINGPSIVSKYLGETEAALRDIFNEAKRYQPAILFIDEIDSLAPSRVSDDSGEVESRVVATLLTLMDGMDGSGRLAVVAATNRPNSIDPALRRPGRFDQEIEISIPDAEARHDILRKQFGRMSTQRQLLSADDIYNVASNTHGYVGADLIALCRESVMKTIQRGLNENIERDNLKVGIDDVLEAMVDIRPSAMREIFLETPKIYWDDIGGQEELKRKMKEMIQLPLEAAETFAKLGVSAPKGVLLYGPPGCSKTLTAKALATESGINFLAVKGPEIFNKYVGESERAIREIFRKARAASPSIIFFDEIDALSPDRDSGSGTSAANHVLTSLLNEIDGVEELKGVIIVAATNRPDEIDPALLRPGRLDRHIFVGPPDYDARLQILKKCTKKFDISSTKVDLKALAECTEGCSGAEVVLLCQEAGLAAIMEDNDASNVKQHHFTKALSGISRGITPEMLEYYLAFAARSGISA